MYRGSAAPINYNKSMNSIRAFIAVEIPGDIQLKLERLSTKLQGLIDLRVIRWTPAHNIHITLKFLGDVPTPDVDKITRLLRDEASRQTPFTASIGGLGVFPSIKKPRVIWTGIEAPPDLLDLQNRIEKGTGRLGYPTEERPFTPHLTLGRMAQNTSLDEIRQVGIRLSAELSTPYPPPLGTVAVDHMTLFRSDLRPGGAVYTSIAFIPFTSSSRP